MISCKINLPKCLGGRTVRASGQVDVILFRLLKALPIYNSSYKFNLSAALTSGTAVLMGSYVATCARRLSACCFPSPFARPRNDWNLPPGDSSKSLRVAGCSSPEKYRCHTKLIWLPKVLTNKDMKQTNRKFLKIQKKQTAQQTKGDKVCSWGHLKTPVSLRNSLV